MGNTQNQETIPSTPNNHHQPYTHISYTNSKSATPSHERVLEGFKRLSSLERELIAKISSKFGELMIENFLSLTAIINTVRDDFPIPKKQKEENNITDWGKDLVPWLVSLNKSVYKTQKQFRNYRLSIGNILSNRNIQLSEREQIDINKMAEGSLP